MILDTLACVVRAQNLGTLAESVSKAVVEKRWADVENLLPALKESIHEFEKLIRKGK